VRCLLVLAPLLFTFTFALAESASAEDVPALLRRTVEAYGGTEALARVVAVRERGEVRPRQRHPGEVGRVLRVFQGAERLRVEIEYSAGAREVRLLDGSRGWRDGVAVSGPLLDSMAIQAARLALPRLLQEQSGALIDRGSVTRGEAPRRQLELPLGGARALVVEIDPDTGRILRSVGRLAMGDGGAMEFVTEYDDFRDVDGVVFAFRERNFAGGVETAETVLESVELLAAPPEDAFAP